MEAIYLSELAIHYFPNSSKRQASMRLRRLIKLNDALWQQLIDSGLKPYQQMLTPSQHKNIVEALGSPR